MKKSYVVGLAALLFWSNGLFSIANCTVITTPWNSSISVDLSTGMEWLDVSETIGMSYDALVARMTTEGDSLYGWRYASGSEVSSFMASAGVVAAGGEINPEDVDFGNAMDLIEIWGGTEWGSPAKGYAGYGGNFIMADDGQCMYGYVPSGYLWAYPAGGLQILDIANLRIGGVGGVIETVQSNFPYGGCYGSALTRAGTGGTTPVPEPSTLLFLSSGIVALAGARIKTRR